MLKGDDQAAATKQDIGLLMEQMGRLYEANEKWKAEIMHEFHVVAEHIIHEVGGAQNDRIVGVENRVTRLEQHTGLPV